MNKIKFVSSLPGLTQVDKLRPQPVKNFIPQWFKNTPAFDMKNDLLGGSITVKRCPSFVDIFNEGYVIPSPCDIYFSVADNGNWSWRVSNKEVLIETHPDFQYLKHRKTDTKQVFKLINPYYIITPKGYSIRQIPMMWFDGYDYKGWYVPYGVIRTDQWHEINQQIFFTSDKNEVLIKAGEPLNVVLPYKREKWKSEIVEPNKKDLQIIRKKRLNVISSFKGGYMKHTEY